MWYGGHLILKIHKGKVITQPWQSEEPSCNYYQQSEKALIIGKVPLAIEKLFAGYSTAQFCAFDILARSNISWLHQVRNSNR